MYYIYTENELFLVMLKSDLIVTLIYHVQIFYSFPISDNFCFLKWRLKQVQEWFPKYRKYLFTPTRSWTQGCRISTQMLCNVATTPTAVRGGESSAHVDWHTCCPISQLLFLLLSRCPWHWPYTVLIGELVCQSTCALDFPPLTAVGVVATSHSIWMEILQSRVQNRGEVTWHFR